MISGLVRRLNATAIIRKVQRVIARKVQKRRPEGFHNRNGQRLAKLNEKIHHRRISAYMLRHKNRTLGAQKNTDGFLNGLPVDGNGTRYA